MEIIYKEYSKAFLIRGSSDKNRQYFLKPLNQESQKNKILVE